MIPKAKLREKDIEKLSVILQYPTEMVKKLESMNMLDTMEARNLLILTDWKALKRARKYKTFQIIEALVNEYQVSKSKVESIIYAKKKSQYWCSKCQKRIPKGEFQRNDGLCDRCVVQSIKL